MKFEVKTDNNDVSSYFFSVFFSSVTILLIVILSIISIKLGKISRHYETNYLCKHLLIEKSSLNFKKLSNLTNKSSKQNIWNFCREFIK